MKKKLAILALGIAAFAGIGATCVVSHVGWTVIEGDFHYGAELKNETSADFLQHKFLVAFVEDDELLEAVTVEGCLRSLQSGATNFYSTHTEKGDPDDTVAISRLKWEDGLKVGEVVEGDLQLSNVQVNRVGAKITVTGTMTNDSNDDYEDARACAVVYNEDDEVVRVEFSSEFDIDAGDSVNFDIEVTVPNDADIADTVDVWADALNADENDTPIEPDSDRNNPVVVGTATPTNTPTETATPTATPTP